MKMLMYEAMLAKRSARSSLSKGSGKVTGVSLLKSLSDKSQKSTLDKAKKELS